MYTRRFGLGDALVSSLAAAIRQNEGSNPNFASNNNPGNLIYVGPNQNGQSGVTMGAGGFAKFSSPASGEAALESQIQNYINRGYDLNTFFNTYAPPNTVNAAGGAQTSAATQVYINNVSSALGLDPSIPLNRIQGSYTGPGSYSAPDSSSFDSSTGFPDLSSLIPSSDSTFVLGGVVLSGTEILTLAALGIVSLVVISRL